jgi:DNA-directed RNA polymerase subunit beta
MRLYASKDKSLNKFILQDLYSKLYLNLCYKALQVEYTKYKLGTPTIGKILQFSLLDGLTPFFNFSPLCQYLDQINPLADITHKRRITTRGPGGITSPRAGFQVRDIHPSFYGRLCPIETPEGKNAGLISSLASYARINKHGFLETPFYKMNMGQCCKKLGPFFLSSRQEFEYNVAPGDLSYSQKTNGNVPTRYKQEFSQTQSSEVDFINVSPIQMISVATSLIPFLEHDDANRVLMGSNMQRQSVPLIDSERPIVGTGFEGEVARASGYGIVALSDGIVTQVDSKSIGITQYLKKPLLSSTFSRSKKRAEFFDFSKEQKLTKPYQALCTKKRIRFNIYKNISSYSGIIKPKFSSVSKKEVNSKQSIFKRRNKLYYLRELRLILFNYALWWGLCPFRYKRLNVAILFCLVIYDYRRVEVSKGLCLWGQSERGKAKGAKRKGQSPHQTHNHNNSYRSVKPEGAMRRGLRERGKAPTHQALKKPFEKELNSNSASNDLKVSLLQKDHLIKLTTNYDLTCFKRSNQKTVINDTPIVNKGDWVQRGDFLADGASTSGGELALGKNVLVAYMPWEGYNFEDAILISDRLVKQDIYTSIYIDRYETRIPEENTPNFVSDIPIQIITKDFTYVPYVTNFDTRNLDEFGFIRVGSWVKPGDLLIGIVKLFPKKTKNFPQTNLGHQLEFATKKLGDLLSPNTMQSMVDVSFRVPSLVEGRVTDIEFVTKTRVRIYIAQTRRIQVGDKLAGRHGNKGIVSQILPHQYMPCLQNGIPIDMVLSPLGVPSRMNVGQIFECLLGLAGTYLKENYKVAPFDEMYGKEASRSLVYSKLYEARKKTGYSWLFEPNHPGKSYLFDGRTAQPYHQPVTIGYPYMLKLIHQVQDKVHARSVGPYATKTQQPLRGKRNQGGQRLGEMEVWALEAFGASFILQEMLTVKSDSMIERKLAFESISYGKIIRPIDFYQILGDQTSGNLLGPEPYYKSKFKQLFKTKPRKKPLPPIMPEAFKLLIYELRAVCFEMQVTSETLSLLSPKNNGQIRTFSDYEVDLVKLKKYMMNKKLL